MRGIQVSGIGLSEELSGQWKEDILLHIMESSGDTSHFRRLWEICCDTGCNTALHAWLASLYDTLQRLIEWPLRGHLADTLIIVLMAAART